MVKEQNIWVHYFTPQGTVDDNKFDGYYGSAKFAWYPHMYDTEHNNGGWEETENWFSLLSPDQGVLGDTS